MSSRLRKSVRSTVAVLISTGVIVAAVNTVFAYYSDPVESARWPGRSHATYSLTRLSKCQGNRSDPACRCDKDDQRYRVNVNSSSQGKDWKFWSHHRLYQNTPTGRTIWGYGFGSSTPHVCVGKAEFLLWWSPDGVATNVFLWAK